MFEILRKSLRTGIVTTSYPETPVEISRFARGRPEIDWHKWEDARPATAACPTGAISYQDTGKRRIAHDGLVAQCGCGRFLCAECAAECSARRLYVAGGHVSVGHAGHSIGGD